MNKINKNMKIKSQYVLCLLLSSTILNGCIGDNNIGESGNSMYNSSDYRREGERAEITHDKPGEKPGEQDKIKDKLERKKEIIKELKKEWSIHVDHEKEIDKILHKIPLAILEAFHKQGGTFEPIKGNWQSALEKYNINPSGKYIDYKAENKKVVDSLAYLVKDVDGKFKLIFRAGNDINYVNNGENRKRLHYAMIKGMLELATSEIDDKALIQLIKDAKSTMGGRFLGHPSINELLRLAALDNTINNLEYRQALNESLAYLLANHGEDPEMMQEFLPDLEKFLSNFDHKIISTIEENLEEAMHFEVGRRSSIVTKDWARDPASCARGGYDCLFLKLNKKDVGVAGFELELKNADLAEMVQDSLIGPKTIITMDQELARSVSVDISGNSVADKDGNTIIKFVVETSAKERFIEAVVAPLVFEELDNPLVEKIFIGLNTLFNQNKKLALYQLINQYNNMIDDLVDDYEFAALSELDADQEVIAKNIKEATNFRMTYNKKFEYLDVTLSPTDKRGVYLQTNLSLDLRKIFSTKALDNGLAKMLFKKNSTLYANYYSYFEEASRIVTETHNHLGVSLIDGKNHPDVALLYKNVIYNFLHELRYLDMKLAADDPNMIHADLDVFFRHGMDDIIYSLLSNDDIKYLQDNKAELLGNGRLSPILLELYKSVNNIANRAEQDNGVACRPSRLPKPSNNTSADIRISQQEFTANPGANEDGLRINSGSYTLFYLGSETILRLRPGKTVADFNSRLIKSNNTGKKVWTEGVLYEYLDGFENVPETSLKYFFDLYFSAIFEIIEERQQLGGPIKLEEHSTKLEELDFMTGEGIQKWYYAPNGGIERGYLTPRPWGHMPLFFYKMDNGEERILTVTELRRRNSNMANLDITKPGNLKKIVTELRAFYRLMEQTKEE